MHTRTSAGLRLIGALQGRVPSPAEQNDQKTTVCAHEHSSRRVVFSLGYSSRASKKHASDPSVFPFGVASGGGHRDGCGELLLHERREGEPLNTKQLWTAAL